MIFTSPWGPLKNWPKRNGAQYMVDSPFRESLDKPAFIDAPTGEVITIREQRTAIRRLAARFQDEYDVKKDDVVLLFGFNTIHTHTIHMAALSVLAVVSPANIMYNASELAHQASVVQPKLVIAADNKLDIAREAMRHAKIDTTVVSYSQMQNEIRHLIHNPSAREQAPIDCDGTTQHAYYCFSSGTSGLPKGVITTHLNIASNIGQQVETNSGMIRDLHVFGAVLPMSHIYGLNSFVWLSQYRQVTCVVFPSFDFEMLLQSIVKYRISMLALVPPIILLFAKHPLVAKYPDIKKYLKFVKSGAAPISSSTIDLASSRLGNLDITQGYGLTETSPVTHTTGWDEKGYDNSTVGWLVPSCEARLVDPDTGKDVGYNERGELWVRGPNIMAGYLKDEKSTKNTFSDDGEWFKTGDVAVVDKSGQFQIVDRIKELIKSKGHQVAPAELEAILLSHPKVSDAAVVGVHDEDGVTELPRAYAVLHADANPRDVLSWFNKKVSKHKRFWGGMVVVDAIPKSPSGKILRRFLRDKKEEPKNIIGMELARL